MVRDWDQPSLVHDSINLLRYIITPSSVKSLVDDGRSLVVGDTYEEKSVTEFAIVSQWRKSWSILGVSTNSAVGHKSSWDTSSRSFLFKLVVCTLPIVLRDHFLIVLILLLFVLIPVVSQLLILLYPLQYLHPFPLSIIHHSPLHFTSPSIIQSYSVPKSTANNFRHIVPPEDIIWFTFVSVTTSFGSLLYLWPGGTVTSLKYETTLQYHRIASLFPRLPYHNIQH